MKVYYIGSNYDGCYYVRCMVPLSAAGWDGQQISLLSRKASNEEMFRGAMYADIVVFQRPMQKEKLEAAKLLKQAGKIIVMDNDDTYANHGGTIKPLLSLSKDVMLTRLGEWEGILKEFAAISDLVTVSTETLKKEYDKVSKNVVVLPNCIDPDDWEEPVRNQDAEVRIGIVGSVANTEDYEVIKPILEDLTKSPGVRLVLFSLPPKGSDYKLAREAFKDEIDFWLSKDIEWQSFVPMAEYMKTLNGLKLDLMLIPRADNYFNRAKSNIKFLEASMCEIPVIAQGFKDGDSPYQNPDDARHMRIAVTRKDWAKHITQLVKDREARRIIGKKAREYVLKNYDIKNKIDLWKEAYHSLK